MTDNLPAERPKPQLSSGATVAAFVPQTLDELYRLGNVMSQSGLSSFKTPESASIAIMAGAELGFSPFQACQSLAVINGRAVLWGDAIPALLLSNGFKIKEWLENEGADYPNDMKAYCEITRPNGQVFTESFSVADAKEGNLWGKSGPWQTAKKRMMKMRARSFCARDGASDVLRGLYVAEEVQDYHVLHDVTPTGTGMVERLQSRAGVEVNPDVLDVRSIIDQAAAATAPATEAQTAPKAKRVSKKEAAAKAAQDAAHDAEFEDANPQDQASVAPAADDVSPEQESAADVSELSVGDDTSVSDNQENPTLTADVQPVEVGQDLSASAIDASDNSAEDISGQTAQDDPSDAGSIVDDFGPDEEETISHPFIEAIGAIRISTTYLAAKQVCRRLSKAPEWTTSKDEARQTVREALWDRYEELFGDGHETIKHTEDVTLFNMFMEFGADSEDELQDGWQAFIKGGAYQQATEITQQASQAIKTRRMAELGK